MFFPSAEFLVFWSLLSKKILGTNRRASSIEVPWTWERESRGQKPKSLEKVSRAWRPKSPKKVSEKDQGATRLGATEANGLLVHVDGEGEDNMYYIDNMDKKHKIYTVKANDDKLYMQKAEDQHKKRTLIITTKMRELLQEILKQ